MDIARSRILGCFVGFAFFASCSSSTPAAAPARSPASEPVSIDIATHSSGAANYGANSARGAPAEEPAAEPATDPQLKQIFDVPFKAPNGEKEFCELASDIGNFRRILADKRNRLAFDNTDPGTFGTALCWWHTRIQRNASYLTFFSPSKPKPNDNEMSQIVDQIIEGKKVVEISGYQNFFEFTRDNEKLIRKKLNDWMVKDTFAFEWTKTFEGSNHDKPDKVRAKMDSLYQQIEVGQRVPFFLLKTNKPGAHSWLIIGMQKHKNGYLLNLLDSTDNQSIFSAFYNYGDSSINGLNIGNAAGKYGGGPDHGLPFEQRKDELDRNLGAILHRCAPQNARNLWLSAAKKKISGMSKTVWAEKGRTKPNEARVRLESLVSQVESGKGLPVNFLDLPVVDSATISPKEWATLMSAQRTSH